MKAKDLPSLIPSAVRVTRNSTYQVLYVDSFDKDPTQQGECRFDPKQITIKRTDSPTEIFKTFLHETLHAMSHEDDINLTESQVRKLEDSLFRVLKLNNLLRK